MSHAVIEYLNTAVAASTVAVPLTQPTGTCVLIFSSIDQSQVSFWQQRIERIQAADMASFYAQLETLVAELENVQLQPKVVAVGLFGDQVLLVGKAASIEVERNEQRKLALPVSDQLSAVAGAFHENSDYILDDSITVTFTDPVTASPVRKANVINPLQKIGAATTVVSRLVPKLQKAFRNFAHAITSLPPKMRMILGGVVVGMFIIIALLIGVQRWQQSQTQQRVETLTQELQQKIQAAQGQVADNPVLARQQLEAILKEYDRLLNDQNLSDGVKNKVREQQQELVKQITALISANERAALDTFFDMRLVQSDFLATKFSLTDKTLLLLDPQPRKIMSLDLNTRTARMLPAGSIEMLTDLTTSQTKAYYLGKGISEADLTNEDSPVSMKLDKEDLAADLIRQFNQNLYVFSRQNRTISRINLDENEDTLTVQNWIKAGQPFEAEKVADFVVDGNVWITTKDGKVLKFATGEEQPFTLQGIAEPPTSPLAIYTEENMPNLYLLEPQKSRLLIIDKNGLLQKEIRSSSLASATGLVVSTAQQKILILSGSQLFEVPLP